MGYLRRLGPAAMASYSPPLWIGTFVMAVFFADISVTGTLQPFYIDEVLHADVEWVGAAITAQFACATVGMPLTGLLADAIGLRRTLLLVSTANVVLLNLVGRTRSIAELLAVRCLLGLASTYALALSWMASLAPRDRLARWMSANGCVAQLAVSVGGFVAGEMRGRDLAFAMLLVSVLPATAVLVLLRAHEVRPPANVSPPPPAPPPAPPPLASPSEAPEAAAPAVAAAAAAAGKPTKGRSGLQRALRTRYFWGVALAPLVQGCYLGGVVCVHTPSRTRTAIRTRTAAAAAATSRDQLSPPQQPPRLPPAPPPPPPPNHNQTSAHRVPDAKPHAPGAQDDARLGRIGRGAALPGLPSLLTRSSRSPSH